LFFGPLRELGLQPLTTGAKTALFAQSSFERISLSLICPMSPDLSGSSAMQF